MSYTDSRVLLEYWFDRSTGVRRGEDRKEAGRQDVDCSMARDVLKEAARVRWLSHFGCKRSYQLKSDIGASKPPRPHVLCSRPDA